VAAAPAGPPPPPGTQVVGQIGRLTVTAAVRDDATLVLDGWLVQTGGAAAVNWFPHLGSTHGGPAFTPMHAVPLRWRGKDGQPERLESADVVVGHRVTSGWKLACWRASTNPFAFTELGAWSGEGMIHALRLAVVQATGHKVVGATRNAGGLLQLRTLGVDSAGQVSLIAEHTAHAATAVAIAAVGPGLAVTASVVAGRPDARMRLDYWRIPGTASESIEHLARVDAGTVEQGRVCVLHRPPEGVTPLSLGHTITGRCNAGGELRLECWRVMRKIEPLPL
jgi:hypothetical protein